MICVLRVFHQACHEVLSTTREAAELGDELWQALSQTIRFGIDQVEMVYEAIQGSAFPVPSRVDLPGGRPASPPPDPAVSHPGGY